MKIIVFGAGGKTGREIMRQAIAQGHAVTAFTRNREHIPQGLNVRVIEGDVTNLEQVAEAVLSQGAVLSALGAPDRKQWLLGKAAENIVAAMQFHSVSRIIVLGAAGAAPGAGRYQNALTNIAFWLVRKVVLRRPFQDQAEQEHVLLASDLDYTIVRPARLTDGPFTGKYRVLPDALPPRGLRISRADVADFMVRQLTDPRFHRQGPYIAD